MQQQGKLIYVVELLDRRTELKIVISLKFTIIRHFNQIFFIWKDL